jgi:hypothetical protein
MNSNYDASLVYQFLVQTPENALRKMLVDAKFTQNHFSMLMKIVRASNEDQFCGHFYNSDYPKSKFTAAEINLKETFWPSCVQALNLHGLLSPAQKIAA